MLSEPVWLYINLRNPGLHRSRYAGVKSVPVARWACRIVKMEFPIKLLQEDKSGTSVGPGDILLGVKWRFFDGDNAQLQFGVYPQLLVPTGERSRGLGEGRTAFVLPLLAQKSCGKWT